jgi:hypothetical protein
MFEFIATLVIFAAVVFALSLGAIFRNRPLKGSCGGLNNLKKLLGFTPCEGCTEAGPDCPLRKIRELQKEKRTKESSNLSEQ